MKKLTCPNCNANLDIEDDNRDFAFCQYCGAKIMLDDYRVTQRIIDDAKIKQTEYEREIRLKELELQEKEAAQKQHTQKILTRIWLGASILVVVICLGVWLFDRSDGGWSSLLILFYVGIPVIGGGGYFIFKFLPEKENEKREIANGGIRFPESVFPYKEKTYTVVENAIKSAGFTNVTLVNMHDVTLGLLKKPNVVESIEVNGVSLMDGGKVYSPSVPISIIYHGK